MNLSKYICFSGLFPGEMQIVLAVESKADKYGT